MYIGGVSFQPSELVKLLLVLALAAGMKDRKKVGPDYRRGLLHRRGDGHPAGAEGLRLDAAVFSDLYLHLLCGDLQLAAHPGRGWGRLPGGRVASYYLFSHVRVRVAIWQNLWVDVEVSGYQMVQSLTAIARGPVGPGPVHGLAQIHPGLPDGFYLCGDLRGDGPADGADDHPAVRPADLPGASRSPCAARIGSCRC